MICPIVFLTACNGLIKFNLIILREGFLYYEQRYNKIKQKEENITVLETIDNIIDN